MLSNLERIMVEISHASRGIGAATFDQLMYERREEIAAAVADAREMMRKTNDYSRSRRAYVDGVAAKLERVTHP